MTILGNDEAFQAAEIIAARDHNNLYLTSCFFQDRERYFAFCGLYALMRVIDDRVDSIPDRDALAPEAKAREKAVIAAWRRAFLAESSSAADLAACEHEQASELLSAARRAMALFPLPVVLWENFFAAMEKDLDQARFPTFADFLDYTEGASVAPTTIYLYLLSAQLENEGRYRVPADFDLIGCGRHLGTFAYIAHIVRDLAADLRATRRGLLYLATDDLAAHGMAEVDLFRDLEQGRAGAGLLALVTDLIGRARAYLEKGRRQAQILEGRLTPDCAYILELIVSIYEEVLRKIERSGSDPLRGEHHLTNAEKQEIALRVATVTRFTG